MSIIDYGKQVQPPWKPFTAKPLPRLSTHGLTFPYDEQAPSWGYRDWPRIRFLAWMVRMGKIRE